MARTTTHIELLLCYVCVCVYAWTLSHTLKMDRLECRLRHLYTRPKSILCVKVERMPIEVDMFGLTWSHLLYSIIIIIMIVRCRGASAQVTF